MPESAECTTTGRRPSAMRSRRTRAMLCQFETDDTLVPPNLSTTQVGDWRRAKRRPTRSRGSVVFENVAQLFL